MIQHWYVIDRRVLKLSIKMTIRIFHIFSSKFQNSRPLRLLSCRQSANSLGVFSSSKVFLTHLTDFTLSGYIFCSDVFNIIDSFVPKIVKQFFTLFLNFIRIIPIMKLSIFSDWVIMLEHTKFPIIVRKKCNSFFELK